MFKNFLGKILGNKNANKQEDSKPRAKFTKDFKKNEKRLEELFRDCGDVSMREITVPALDGRRASLRYVQGLINNDTLQRDILGKLLEPHSEEVKDIRGLISAGAVTAIDSMEEFAGQVFLGKVGIILQGENKAYLVEAKNWPKRTVEEPLQERLIRGPREGFIEVIQVNLALIRRRLPHPNLKMIMLEVGRRSKTEVAILYIEDVCNLDTVREIEERIRAIDIDNLLESGCLEELITERTFSPFPQMLQTERPDKVAAGLSQGKIAIVTDGSCFAALAPTSFDDFIQVPDDYYMDFLYGTLGRVLRFIGLFTGTTVVAAYVAVLSFHYEIVPTNIVIFIAQTRAGVPFDPLTEALLLEFFSEILREASIRLPGPVGPTLGIVGALILGQAAVAARLVSPIMLFLVALTFILSSIIPNYEASTAMRYLRFPLIIAAGFL